MLENEIKKYFNNKPFDDGEINQWMIKLEIIFKKLGGLDFISNRLSSDDVYSSKKIEMDLPIGSFSLNGGVFIPVPSYLNEKMELVNSHWIYVKGMWDGHNWVDEWFPKVPSFVKLKGEKSKIYYENGGYWIYDSIKGIYLLNLILEWYWSKTENIKQPDISNEDIISNLNTIKFDVSIFNIFLTFYLLDREILTRKD